jgi:mRNA interferase MazF
VKRYEVRWAQLDPTVGAEMAKTRPAVIVSLDALNERLQTVTVCPLTSQVHSTWRSRLGVRVAGRRAEIAVDQIRTVSKVRIGRKVGVLTAADASALRRLIAEMYGEA